MKPLINAQHDKGSIHRARRWFDVPTGTGRLEDLLVYLVFEYTPAPSRLRSLDDLALKDTKSTWIQRTGEIGALVRSRSSGDDAGGEVVNWRLTAETAEKVRTATIRRGGRERQQKDKRGGLLVVREYDEQAPGVLGCIGTLLILESGAKGRTRIMMVPTSAGAPIFVVQERALLGVRSRVEDWIEEHQRSSAQASLPELACRLLLDL